MVDSSFAAAVTYWLLLLFLLSILLFDALLRTSTIFLVMFAELSVCLIGGDLDLWLAIGYDAPVLLGEDYSFFLVTIL